MSTKIIILGVLIEGDKHPYAMKQLIKERQMDKYIKLQKGSLYYAVNQLQKEGCIEIVNIVRDNNNPDKTVYRITEKGRQVFHELLLEQLYSGENNYCVLNTFIAFMSHLEKEELIKVLKSRITMIEKELEELKGYYNKNELNTPKFGLRIISGGYNFYKVELNLFKALLKDVENDSLMKFESLDDFKLD